MKALVLSAGLGTRLLPYTRMTPKPLFSINEKPLLGLTLEQLRQAGCQAAIVNTHHLSEQIEAFVSSGDFGFPVFTRHEKYLLGTGGAIRNVADFWGEEPLLVVNADIVSSIDLAAVYHFHTEHAWPATLVMHDCATYNKVAVDDQDFITGFAATGTLPQHQRRLAFTGIHVIDRSVLTFLPACGPAHIIDTYVAMIAAGCRLKACIAQGHYWRDIGTPENYRRAVMDEMGPLAFTNAFQTTRPVQVQESDLAGDGSDRRWRRLKSGPYSLVVADHGIRLSSEQHQEVDAFVAIGIHLCNKGIEVPHIHLFDRFAGLVFMEDLGDVHLQRYVQAQPPEHVAAMYRHVIDAWLSMAIAGSVDFNPDWTWQTPLYDRNLILEKECRYFIEAWVRGWLGWQDVGYAEFASEFEQLADRALDSATMAFMHRDLQSRNIMLKNDCPCFIDFQGGRIGPMQYDLASLLIDPYVALAPQLQAELRAYAARRAARALALSVEQFLRCYPYCAVTRNLQILGAFGFLSQSKGKTMFAAFIPQALQTLRYQLDELAAELGRPPFPRLAELVKAAARNLGV